jgi:hypothetical protein
MRKGVVAFSGMIAGLVLLVVAFMGPWYTMNGSGALGAEYSVEFSLTNLEAKGSIAGQEFSWSTGYAQAEENAQTVGVNTQSFSIIQTARSLTLFAMVAVVLALLGMAAFVFQVGTQRIMKYVGGGFGLLAVVCALVPVVYVMTAGFSENSSGFWFSQTVLGVTVTGAPGYAWYLMIAAVVVLLISAVAVLLKKVAPEAAEPPAK